MSTAATSSAGRTVAVSRQPRLAARGVTVRFGGITALDDVTISVPPSSIIGLIGPNGAGKSTLFAVLSGLLKPDGGTVEIDGTDVTAASPQRRAGLGLARTFQHPELFAGLTVREHLVLAHRVRHARRRLWTDLIDFGGFRRPPADEDKRIDDLMGALGLTELASAPAVGLPLGLSRLVEIARAIAVSPRVILLDEPSSGLDQAETEQFVAVLRRLVRLADVSLLLVEHDVDLVMGLCSEVSVLDFGKLIAHGTPEEVRAAPQVRAAYLGDAEPVTEDGEKL
jgi:ABC-type branched-subunit amino acid transport system ATPase component